MDWPHFVVPVNTEKSGAGIVKPLLHQIILAPVIIVCAHISQQDDYVLHCGMYFGYKLCDAIHGTMNISCEKDRKASPSCTCHTGKSSSPCLLLSIVLHFCFFRIAVLWFLRIEYLHIIQAETSQPAENA